MTDVNSFFERYGQAFEAYDADAIAACFLTPCLFVRDGTTETSTTPDEVAASVRALLDLHRAWDVQTATPAEVTVLEEGGHHAIARVEWTLGRTNSRVAWAFATTYTLVAGADDWRIASAITHDAPF